MFGPLGTVISSERAERVALRHRLRQPPTARHATPRQTTRIVSDVVGCARRARDRAIMRAAALHDAWAETPARENCCMRPPARGRSFHGLANLWLAGNLDDRITDQPSETAAERR
jgi:hypothetical protein